MSENGAGHVREESRSWNDGKCPIWCTPCRIAHASDTDEKSEYVDWIESEQAGKYKLPSHLRHYLKSPKIHDGHRQALTEKLEEQRKAGVTRPELTKKMLKEVCPFLSAVGFLDRCTV